MESDALKIAVVGAGYFAQFHLDAWRRMSDADLVGVCDADEGRRLAALERAPQAKAYESLPRLLDELDVDLVDIATPPETHLELVRVAARAGKAIICQKPLAPTFEQAQRLVEEAEAAGVLLVVHENFRFTPWHREMRRLLETGLLGDIYGATMRMRPGDGQGPDAYLARQPYFQQMPRFLVHETGIHWIDTFRYLLGEIKGVYASLRRLNPAIAGEDAGRVEFDIDTGATALFDGNRLVDHDADNTRLTMGDMWLEGSAGVLRLDGRARLWWKPHNQPEVPHPYACPATGFAGDCVLALQSHVVAHLRANAVLENTGREYLRNLQIEEAVYRSADARVWIDLGA